VGCVTTTRLIAREDAPELTALLIANREFLGPTSPPRAETFFTTADQLAGISNSLTQYEDGSSVPHVIIDSGRIAGRITLTGIVRAPSFLSCSVGYWVSRELNGRGLATAALREMVGIAFGELGLHRVQAEILADNTGSQRVLERNGFYRIGMAPAYLRINGRWQDHVLFQALNPAMS
jgi:ribosomal-protein-alanine N-acetyltransferase